MAALNRLPDALSNGLDAGDSMRINRHDMMINDRLLTLGDDDELKF